MCIRESFTTSKINKMSSRLPLAIYAAMHEADIPGPWHYKGKMDAEVLAATRVMAEMLLLGLKTEKNKKKRVWARTWIKRISQLGCSATLMEEIVVEDPKSYHNHLRMTSGQFNYLLERILS